MKQNHEVRFKVDQDLKEAINQLREKTATGLLKADFERAIFLLGFNTIKTAVLNNKFPKFVKEKTFMEVRIEK